MYSINCKGSLVDFSEPRVMGIINVTPDSFYDGGKTQNISNILAQANRMLSEGATFLDVGGYSSRPGADDVSPKEEMQRVIPAIAAIHKEFPDALISIDTFRSEVAKQAVLAGAVMVNDISGGRFDPQMLNTVAVLKTPYIIMHSGGTIRTMTQVVDYKNIIQNLLFHFSDRFIAARSAGIDDLIMDFGFGFAKSKEDNFKLLNQLELFTEFHVPVLVGISRKSMIYQTLNNSPSEALNGTTALHSIALLKGANILRVHDVREAIECIRLVAALKGAGDI